MAIEQRTDWRFRLGVGLTVLWLGAGYYFWHHFNPPADLNGLGGFFSGFFAPVAFLWLVLGYLQQAEELRHSTEALRVQADELKNSVEQQKDLVAVSREQMQREIEALQEERELRRRAALPKFVLHHADTSSGAYGTVYRIIVTNVGNTATALTVSAEPHVGHFSRIALPLLQRNQEHALGLNPDGPFETLLTFSYYDADGLPGAMQIPVSSDGAKVSVGAAREVPRGTP